MGRILWYAGASTALAATVVVSAFSQRANFYSACIFMAQSNLCLMILINLILLVYGSFMYGLQRLCYGQLRPIEVEQLYEKAWFAITETALAMTIFREEVGPWFIVMFVALLTGKVAGWISEGRVDVLEQQPPANPRLFHIRLTTSLAISILFDLVLMNYTVNTVIQTAKPNMMVMFLFEFAILTTSTLGTAFRYGISLVEAKIVKKQTQDRLTERRTEVRAQRAEMIREREAAGDAADTSAPLPSEDDVEEMDIEVPGWEAKGHWVLMLDLVKDFVKLTIYITFFIILLMFYGLPIHIMRDLFLTARSFAKRLAAFFRYRRATSDMNSRYEDATVEDLQREDTCIICREEMRPWQQPAANPVPGVVRPGATVNERSRPKKLPCGHVIHLGCLKSWLERQQVCPTCRRPVVDGPQGQNPPGPANNANQAAQGAQPQNPGQQNGQGPPAPAGGGDAAAPNRGMRMLNFGPLRVGFGQANLQDLAQNLREPQAGQQNAGVGGNARIYGLEFGFPRRNQAQPPATANPIPTDANALQTHLQQIELQIAGEIRNLQLDQQELHLVQLLQAELARLRLIQNGGADPLAPPNFQMPPMPQLGPLGGRPAIPSTTTVSPMQRHGVRQNATVIPAGSAELPDGLVLPEGWSLLPLQRLDGPVAHVATMGGGPAATAGLAPTATTQATTSPTNMSGTGVSNNTLTPAINAESQSQASSVNSSDTNAIHTPPSVNADQSGASIPDPTLQTSTAPAPSVTAPTLHEDLNPLPDWGAAQMFPGSSRTSAPATQSTTQDSAPPLSGGVEQTTTDAGPSTVHNNTATAGNNEDEERSKEKGKARAVTVEDTEDEANGA